MPRKSEDLPTPRLRHALIAIFLALGLPALAQDLGKLPEWARPHAEAAAREQAPPGQDAWVLFERTEFGYRGGGEIRVRKFRLVWILTERGLDEGNFRLWGMGGDTSSIKEVKGWNLRRDGEVTRMDRSEVFTFSFNSSRAMSPDTYSFGTPGYVAKGSLVAFESQENFTGPLGPVAAQFVLEKHPVRTWELELVPSLGLFTLSQERDVRVQLECRRFSPWLPEPVPGATSIKLANLPALPRHEAGHPPAENLLPRIYMRVLDPAVPNSLAVEDWNRFAARFVSRFPGPKAPFRPADLKTLQGPAALAAIHRWMQRELAYRQIYLTPARGYTPQAPEETLRERSGDCKDLANAFIAAAKEAGYAAYPALTRIGEGVVEAGAPVSPYVFNHAIAAVQLKAPQGLPAEVATPLGRFLLVDCTDRFTPLGRLDSAHRGGRVLICTPEGGVFAEIPDSALVRAKVRSSLEGSLDAQGQLKGALTLEETGNALGLRHNALYGGAKGLRETLARHLEFPPGTQWSLPAPQDPLDGTGAYAVRILFSRPGSLKRNGRERLLPRMGLPGVSAPIQRKGEPRRFPVAVRNSVDWEYDALIHAAMPLNPVASGATLETALRTATWSAETRDGDLHLHFAATGRDLVRPFSLREEGVRLQREDRKRFGTFLEDALSLTLAR